MTNMNPNEGFTHFGVVTAAVCLPTYFLIGIINQPDQFERTVAFLGYPLIWISTGFKHSSDRAKTYRDRYMHRKEDLEGEGEVRPELKRANTMADLDFRLNSEASRDRLGSVAVGMERREEMLDLAKSENAGTSRPALPARESTIRFDVPMYRRSSTAPEAGLGPEPSPNTSVPEFDKEEIIETGIGDGGRLKVPQRVERRRHEGIRSNSAPTRTLLRRFTAGHKGADEGRSPV